MAVTTHSARWLAAVALLYLSEHYKVKRDSQKVNLMARTQCQLAEQQPITLTSEPYLALTL